MLLSLLILVLGYLRGFRGSFFGRFFLLFSAYNTGYTLTNKKRPSPSKHHVLSVRKFAPSLSSIVNNDASGARKKKMCVICRHFFIPN